REPRALVRVQPIRGDDACNAAHGLDGLRVSGPRSRGLVDELAEPELEHHQLPEPVAMVGFAVAVFGPEPRDLAVVEDAAVAQPAVRQQAAGHRRERAAQPFADRRLEALLAAIEDVLRD